VLIHDILWAKTVSIEVSQSLQPPATISSQLLDLDRLISDAATGGRKFPRTRPIAYGFQSTGTRVGQRAATSHAPGAVSVFEISRNLSVQRPVSAWLVASFIKEKINHGTARHII